MKKCLVLLLKTHLQVAASSLLHRPLIEGRRSGFFLFAGMDAVLIRYHVRSQGAATGVVLPDGPLAKA